MFSASTGWAQTPYMCALRTTDAGNTWLDTTPGWIVEGMPVDCDTYFLNADDAWITRVEAWRSSVLVDRTNDGGKIWTRLPPVKTDDGRGGVQMDFVDSKHGWLETIGSVGDASSAELFKTIDGGEAWTRVSSTGSRTPGHLLVGNIAFSDVSRGWLAGQEAQGSQLGPWLFHTRDAGTSWNHVDLPVPRHVSTDAITVSTPRFFGRRAGLVVANFASGGLLFATKDGGSTWTLVHALPCACGVADFVSPAEGWIAGPHYLYRTRDGGVSWKPIKRYPLVEGAPGNHGIASIDFISDSVGWVLLRDPGSSLSSRLLATSNGGQSWRLVKWKLITRPGGA